MKDPETLTCEDFHLDRSLWDRAALVVFEGTTKHYILKNRHGKDVHSAVH